ncbi:hypothetical protein GCM10009557_47010 [Virgisporangium ochraceum]|uniref:Uncharacterized protein n=1 Tax=Virgisporangium ochraceum TaxID=65505 RepID=A0A8J3ZQQ5_9ACTN|nr:hypothetical protein [Virgisporangium ochraceum]GIJ65810.1 hypothetical protein Voc01_007270 [Virgisporangium ochraceum]
MQTDVAAPAVTFADRGNTSPDDDNPEPPENDTEPEPPAEQPRHRRRWWNRVPGGAFLDGPTDDRYSNLWLGACGQGG